MFSLMLANTSNGLDKTTGFATISASPVHIAIQNIKINTFFKCLFIYIEKIIIWHFVANQIRIKLINIFNKRREF